METDIVFEIDEQFQVDGVPSSLSAQDYAKVSRTSRSRFLKEIRFSWRI